MAEKENKTIIFTETKRGSDELTRQMRREGWPGMCIHGDKTQQERDWVLREFRSGRSPILVATDVAARGLGKWGCEGWVVRAAVKEDGGAAGRGRALSRGRG